MNNYLDKLRTGAALSESEITGAMRLIMEGQVPESELEEFLTLLARRGETAEELTGAARVMREKAALINAPSDAVDCCGTGGDGKGTYNISTAVALVAAACGVPVAKHGNRASSSKSGTADVLEALGVNLDMAPAALEDALSRMNFAFLMAPHHHPAVRHAGAVRKKLGRRTIFNLLGPLANPANTRYQLMGVFGRAWLRPMAETLRNLGTQRAWIVCGTDGLDEITMTGPTYVAMLSEDGSIKETQLQPADFGLPLCAPEELIGGTAEENAAALTALLEGKPGAYRDIVLANTAATLVIHGSAKTLKEGVAMAAVALDNGAALKVLKDYAAFSRGGLS